MAYTFVARCGATDEWMCRLCVLGHLRRLGNVNGLLAQRLGERCEDFIICGWNGEWSSLSRNVIGKRKHLVWLCEFFPGPVAKRFDHLSVCGEDIGKISWVLEGYVSAGIFVLAKRFIQVPMFTLERTYSSMKYFSSVHSLNSFPFSSRIVLTAFSSFCSSHPSSLVIHRP